MLFLVGLERYFIDYVVFISRSIEDAFLFAIVRFFFFFKGSYILSCLTPILQSERKRDLLSKLQNEKLKGGFKWEMKIERMGGFWVMKLRSLGVYSYIKKIFLREGNFFREDVEKGGKWILTTYFEFL